jgi:hypothetical protein
MRHPLSSKLGTNFAEVGMEHDVGSVPPGDLLSKSAVLPTVQMLSQRKVTVATPIMCVTKDCICVY